MKIESLYACLYERNACQLQLNRELQEIEAELDKAEFEEELYYRLKETRSFEDDFTEKHEAYEEKCKELEKKKSDLEHSVKVLDKEIDAIKNYIKNWFR